MISSEWRQLQDIADYPEFIIRPFLSLDRFSSPLFTFFSFITFFLQACSNFVTPRASCQYLLIRTLSQCLFFSKGFFSLHSPLFLRHLWKTLSLTAKSASLLATWPPSALLQGGGGNWCNTDLFLSGGSVDRVHALGQCVAVLHGHAGHRAVRCAAVWCSLCGTGRRRGWKEEIKSQKRKDVTLSLHPHTRTAWERGRALRCVRTVTSRGSASRAAGEGESLSLPGLWIRRKRSDVLYNAKEYF